MKVRQTIEVGPEIYSRDVELPFPPFPGLWIGAFRVRDVLVVQGTEPDVSAIEVMMEPATSTVGLDGWDCE